MGAQRKIHRQSLLTAQATGIAATSTRVLTLREIDNIPLLYFDELYFYLDVTTALTGTGPAMELHGMKARKGGVSEDTQALWDGIFSFDQTTPAVGKIVHSLPWLQTLSADNLANAEYVPGPIGAGIARPAHWGDVMTIWEEIAGTTLTAGVYSLDVTGIIHG